MIKDLSKLTPRMRSFMSDVINIVQDLDAMPNTDPVKFESLIAFYSILMDGMAYVICAPTNPTSSDEMLEKTMKILRNRVHIVNEVNADPANNIH
jgi:hypothetical protein